MKQTFFPRRYLFRLFTLGALGLAANEMIAQDVYRFHCRDYVTTPDRPGNTFVYDDEANTFTIQNAGIVTNNTAFQMDKSKDGNYYINNTQEWFLVRGTDLNANGNVIWWFNGFNNPGNSQNHNVTDENGITYLLWDMKNTPAINVGMDFSSPTILLSSGGKEFINCVGLTSTTGSSTISDIGYYAPYEAAATYPVLMETLGYTDESLTTETKEALNQAIQDAQAAIQDDVVQSEAKTAVENAINVAQGIISTGETTDYTTAFNALNELRGAMDTYKNTVVTYSYKTTDYGIQARLNDQYVHIMLYADDIVRVVKGYTEDIAKKSLSVVDTPQSGLCEVAEDTENKTVTVSTSKVKVVYHLATGQVEVLRYNGAELLREKAGGTSFLAKKDGPFDSYQITSTFQLEDDEQIYGMGQIQDGNLNRRGQTHSLAQNNMKVCIPYFQSTKNYALFWDNYSPTTFTDNEEGTRFQSTGMEIDYYVLCGEDGNDVLASMRELTGKAPLMPLWNFGLYQSKERYTSADEVKQVVDEYRRLGVPLDCIVQDWQYWGTDNAYWNALEFLNPAYSNPEEMIDHVHSQNAKFMISIWANFGPNTKPYAKLKEMGRLIPVDSYPLGCGVNPYDAYDTEAQDVYWDFLYDGLISKGIDAYWMDSTEPDYTAWQNPTWKESDLDYLSGEGRTWRSLRNAFPLAQVGGVSTRHRQAEAQGDSYLAGKRVSILTRSAFAGQQRYGANTWSGDVTASWQNFAAQIPAACNLSICGIPYWNSDIGGFFTGGYGGVGDPNWRQLYMRWMQFGTFTPMMRFHGTNTPREIWQFGSADDGLGDYDQILKYVKMRYRMLPYLYSTAWQVYKNDATFMRALAIAFNGDPQGYDVKDEYMFGDAFLVAPVVQEAAPGRNVYLPEGTKWVDFWTGETLNGGQTVNKQANVDIIPLYVRAGSILPWGPDVQYSTEKPWDNLEIRVYPGADGSFTLYEDENDGYGYEDGAYTEIPFTWDDDTQTLTIGARNGQFDGMLENRTFRIVKVSTRRGTGDLHTTQYEAVVTYDGSETQIVLDSKDQEIGLTDITTDYIKNPSFEENNGSTNGWTLNCNTTNWGVNPSGGDKNPLATDGNYLFYVWDDDKNKNADISQQITLPAGTYRLTVDMHAPDRTNEKRVGNQRLYVDDAIAYFKDQVPSAGMTDNYPLQTISLDFTVAADNTPVTIGVTTSDAPAETWYKIDNFRLYAVSRPVLELDEEKDYTNEQEGMTDVHILRSLKADTWNTFCVPFSLDEAQAEAVFNEVKALSSVEKNGESYTLNFTDAASIEAGTPYLVKPTAATTELTLQDVAVTNTETTSAMVDGVSLIGTYSPMTIANGEFFISDNAFYLADVPVPMKGYRSYIKLDENPGNRVNRLLIAIDGIVTGVGEVLDAKADGDKPVDVYTVGGLQVKAGVRKADALRGLPKGVYVVDGEKYVK